MDDTYITYFVESREMIMSRGIAVEFRYPDEGAARTPGSGY